MRLNMWHVNTLIIKSTLVLLLYSLSISAQDDLLTIFKRRPMIREIATSTFTFKFYEYHINDRRSQWDGLRVCWVKFPKELVEIKIKDLRQNGNINGVYENACNGKELIVMSGGFFDEGKDGKMPVGLLISEGKVLSDVATWESGGILFQNEVSLGIIPIGYFEHINKSKLKYAIQSKPLVVQDSRNGIYSDDKIFFDRVGVGFTNDNQLIIGGAFNRSIQALSLYQFGKLMATKKEDDGPDGKLILAMDGGPGAHIYIPSLDLHFGHAGEKYVANTIHIYLKE